uniref:Zn(2)-C6 fungal-type domain-containing protein n=1 Tax=Ganoderma boninense TaxID=34458 RepID=A0A5K1JWC1_9APHY|nr:Zn(2)-C6 fungal-type domain-containing protein [Ganoderma boninense]
MDPLVTEVAPERSTQGLRRFHDDYFEATSAQTTSPRSFADLALRTETPSESVHGVGEDSLSSASDTDSDSTQSTIPEGRAKCNPDVYSEKRVRRWASTLDLRPAVQAARARLVELPRSPQLARHASTASLLPIQPPPLEDGCRDDKIPDQSPRMDSDVVAEDAQTVLPDASGPLISGCSSRSSSERAAYELNISVGDVFKLRLCTKIPTHLEIKQL